MIPSSRAGDFTITASSSPSKIHRKSITAIPTNYEKVSTVIPGNESTNTTRKSSKNLWFIHGKFYDLTEFMKSHPGGTAILDFSRGTPDATPVFESYHAFANRDYIMKTLQKYEVDFVPEDVETREKTQVNYSFEEKGFYRVLTERVRDHFGAKSWNESIAKNVKANRWWVFKVFAQTLLYSFFYGTAFLYPKLNTTLSVLSAFAAGVMLIAVGMNAMHDGSHYAIGARDSWKNKVTMRIWNAVAYWDPSEWLFHHTVRHHAYTGDDKLDPDTVHARPLIRKHPSTNRKDYLYHVPHFLIVQRWFWSLYSGLTIGSGMFVTQILSYHVFWPYYGELWNMPYEIVNKGYFQKVWWEYAIIGFMILTHVIKMNPLVSLAYFLGSNFTYFLCIVPDHDTYDSAITNHIDEGNADWGEIQVRHASDFGGKGTLGRAFTEFFGSINVQIAHHLYPGLNHIYLPEIVPIIKKTCEEYNIPYAHQGTVPEAVFSFFKTVYACMGENDGAGIIHHTKAE